MLVRWLCIVLLLGCMAGCDSDDNNGGLPDVFVEDTGSDMGEELDRGTPDAADEDTGGGSDLGPDDAGGGDADVGPGTLPGLALQQVASGLTSPVAMAFAGDGSQRTFIVDQIGLIRVLDADFMLDPVPFADLTDRLVPLMDTFDERGLLGLTFHPDFASNGRLYVYYSAPLRASAPDDFDHTNVVSEFMVDANGDFDPTSERVLLEVDHPYFNHNAGTVAFGDDGYLYISIGDGGNANDVGIGHTPGLGNAQDITNLHGNILRIDVDSGDPYGIPADNPFAMTVGADEIYAYGFRNPYRFSFDRQTGDLFVGDAGQDLMEEVSLVELGGNYGWNIKEGTLCFNPDAPTDPPETCANIGAAGEPLVDPILTFARPLSAFESPSQEITDIIAASPVVGLVVVGGHVYRGSAMPDYDGRYIYGAWSDSFADPLGKVFVGTNTAEGWTTVPAVIDGATDGSIGHFILSFGEDADGEIYVLTTDNPGPNGSTGQVFRLTAQ